MINPNEIDHSNIFIFKSFNLLIYKISGEGNVRVCTEITKFYLLLAFRNLSAISGKLNFSYPICWDLCR